MLLGAARMALQDAADKRPGYFYYQLIIITFSGLAVEAICNAFGERYVPAWKDFESSGPIAKLRVLCEQFGIEYCRNREPWATALWLVNVRNKIAHARPELVTEEYVWSRTEYDSRQAEEPKSKLEKQITLGHAKNGYESAVKIKELLSKSIPAEDTYGLQIEGWVGSATLKRDG